jgi:hypothetical protein
LLRPQAGDDAFRPLAIDTLRLRDGLVADIVTFDGGRVRAVRAAATLEASAV